MLFFQNTKRIYTSFYTYAKSLFINDYVSIKLTSVSYVKSYETVWPGMGIIQSNKICMSYSYSFYLPETKKNKKKMEL